MNSNISDIAIETAVSWLELAFPAISALKGTINGCKSLSEFLLIDKLIKVLTDQDSDYAEWLKISEHFDENSKSYQETVKQLIYYVNAINEAELLHAYSNLLRAYKNGFINKSDFFRLSFSLTNLLSEDADYLKNNIQKEDIPENIHCLALASNNLMYNRTRGIAEGDENGLIRDKYCFTEIGKMLDKYALSYGAEDRYRYNTQHEKPLEDQKLDYKYLESAEGKHY